MLESSTMPNCHSLFISRPTTTALSQRPRVSHVSQSTSPNIQTQTTDTKSIQPRITLDDLPNEILDHILRLVIPEEYRVAGPRWKENPKLPVLLVNHRIAEHATNQSSIGGQHISGRFAHDVYKTIARLLDGCSLSKRVRIQRVVTSDHASYKRGATPAIRAIIQSRVEAKAKKWTELLSCYYEDVAIQEITVIWKDSRDYGYGSHHGPAHYYNAWTYFQVCHPRDPGPLLERALRVVPFWCRTN